MLIGGRVITGFVPYRGQILKAEVGSQGFKDVYFRQLYFAGERQPLARYPNFDPQKPRTGGWAYAAGKTVPMYDDVADEDRHSFACSSEDLRHWSHPEEAEVFVFARYNWWNDICPVKAVDPATDRITLAKDASFEIRPDDRYYFQNALEELDAPGEWYLDRRTWTLYFWPPASLIGKEVMAPTTRNIIELRSGTTFLTVRGFTLECAEGTAIALSNTDHCLIAANTIHNVGDYNGNGVTVDGGFLNGVVGNDLDEIGRHGISLSGGDRVTLAAAGNYADNNYIHHIGVYYKQGVGIELSGVGNRASHNLIHDGPGRGISFSGNNLVIEYNEIRHVDLETEDTGAIYTSGRDWISSRGSIIRYNYLHDIVGYGRDENGQWRFPYHAWGVYLDDNTGGVDVVGNIIVRCPNGALHLHNARDNRIWNNVLVENGLQQVEYNGWTSNWPAWKTWLPSMKEGYAMVEESPAWRAFRNMKLRPENAPLADGLIMAGNEFVRNIVYYENPSADYFKCANVPFDHNVIDGNLIWHFGLSVRVGNVTDEWEAWQKMGLDLHSVVADPLFENPGRDDYRLKVESPAHKIGFEPIPINRIGPYRDRWRATWPVVETEGARERTLKGEGL